MSIKVINSYTEDSDLSKKDNDLSVVYSNLLVEDSDM